MMDFSSLYELLERFHRTNQLPVFLLGIVVALPLGFFIMRLLRLKLVGANDSKSIVSHLKRSIDSLTSDNSHLNDKLNRLQERRRRHSSTDRRASGLISNPKAR